MGCTCPGMQVWEAKEARIKSKSELGRTDGWALRSLIVKSNDDVRQEVYIVAGAHLMTNRCPLDNTLKTC